MTNRIAFDCALVGRHRLYESLNVLARRASQLLNGFSASADHHPGDSFWMLAH